MDWEVEEGGCFRVVRESTLDGVKDGRRSGTGACEV